MTPEQKALFDIESELSEAEACIDRAIVAFKKVWPNVDHDTNLIDELRGLRTPPREPFLTLRIHRWIFTKKYLKTMSETHPPMDRILIDDRLFLERDGMVKILHRVANDLETELKADDTSPMVVRHIAYNLTLFGVIDE